MDTIHSSKLCRICCNQRSNDLHFLLDADNKTIVKKLRACADVTIEHDDLLPKYICKNCIQKLNLAYNFKIQCEYMEQKLREAITKSLHTQMKSASVAHKEVVSSSFFDSDDESSFGYSSELLAMDDGEAIIEEDGGEEEEEEQFMEEIVYLDQNVECDQVANGNQFVSSVANQQFEASNNDVESNAMEISQKTVETEKFDSVGSMPSAKESDGDQDMFSVKSDNASSPNVKIPFKCDTCGETFDIHSEYNKHKKTHGKNRYQCLLCNKWFAKRYLLNAHHKTHSGTKNYECSMCQKRYTSQSNLDRHIRVFHRQERQHTCTTCQKTFSQLSILRQHQSVHIASREFACDVCHNKFKTEVHLKLHKKRHLPNRFGQSRRKYTPPKKTTRKPPQKMCVCSECGKRFTSVALLRSHMQSHSLEKKYECKI
ncbi:zinc finger protein 569-like, partial [Contarinia nasturtii]|uniref:zinc finger protein 569-like n=1 Tax=Contarinia nasturtii TaxID=265458 RepID=UPI0012D3BDF6